MMAHKAVILGNPVMLERVGRDPRPAYLIVALAGGFAAAREAARRLHKNPCEAMPWGLPQTAPYRRIEIAAATPALALDIKASRYVCYDV